MLHPGGFILLSKGAVLERRVIDQVVTVERDSGRSLEIFVMRGRVGR